MLPHYFRVVSRGAPSTAIHLRTCPCHVQQIRPQKNLRPRYGSDCTSSTPQYFDDISELSPMNTELIIPWFPGAI